MKYLLNVVFYIIDLQTPLIVFLAVTGSGARIEGNLSLYPEGSLSH